MLANFLAKKFQVLQTLPEGSYFCTMTEHLSHSEAWEDFWGWIRSPQQADRWASLSRKERQYLAKADIHNRSGKLGYERTKNLLTKHAPGRYEFLCVVIFKG